MNRISGCFWKKYIAISILWLIPLIGITSLASYSLFHNNLDTLAEKQDISISIAKQNIKHLISHQLSDINIIYDDINYRIQNDLLDLKHLSLQWISFMVSKKKYDQIRIINAQGMEILRINYNSGAPSITPEKQLQDKSSRYYFIESIKLEAGKIYISPLDLNKEQGKIERPLKAMIRYAIPFNTKEGNKGGVIIFNYQANTLIKEIKAINKQYLSTINWLNSDGYYFVNKDINKEWGFMYNKKIVFKNENKNLWAFINNNDTLSASYSNNYYSFNKIYPYHDINDSYEWILVSHLPPEVRQDILYTKIKSLFPIFISITIILLIITWKLTTLKLKHQDFVNNLEFLVEDRTKQLEGEIKIRKKVEKKLVKMANYDELTGLANRLLFIDRLNLSISLAQRANVQLALLFIDLDGFKEVNDSYGHNVGDLLLKQVSNRLLSSIRESDLVGRIGGDEFLVLLQNTTSNKYISHIAQHIVKQLSDDFIINGQTINISCSIGIALYDGEDEASKTLIERADKAMYEVKESGKNNYKILPKAKNKAK